MGSTLDVLYNRALYAPRRYTDTIVFCHIDLNFSAESLNFEVALCSNTHTHTHAQFHATRASNYGFRVFFLKKKKLSFGVAKALVVNLFNKGVNKLPKLYVRMFALLFVSYFSLVPFLSNQEREK